MPRLDLIVVPGVALLAGIVIGAVLYRLGVTDAVGAMLVAGFIAVVASYCDLILDRTSERARTQSTIDHMRVDADLTRRAVIELKQHMDTSIALKGERMASEVKVLESLVRKLAEGIAGRSKQIAPAAGETTAVAARTTSDTPSDIMLDTVRRSLEENRIDIYLQPVVSLPQRKVRFYEALTRLRAADGTIIMPSQYMQVAEPAGLMSVVDNVLLFRCIQILRNLSNKAQDIGVFCNLSRETLQDQIFFAHFTEFMQQHKELAGSLIFEISQETLEQGTPAEIANLSQLADLGFTFSMDKVTTLDIDFASARARQVRYFKVPANLLLADASKSGARVHPGDLKELLARFGLDLIAEKVENERDVIRLLDHDVDYGQGFLFGEPQQIRDTLLGQRQQRPAPQIAPPPQRLRAVKRA
jgi:cyclic-di-GMP phosphodiesterase TipF (flagellum assembly factor)